MKKLLIAIVLIGGATAAGYYYFYGAAAKVEYTKAKVDRGDIESVISATGNCNAVVTVQVGSQVSGNIIALYADFNTKVKRGQLVARIDPANADAKLLKKQLGDPDRYNPALTPQHLADAAGRRLRIGVIAEVRPLARNRDVRHPRAQPRTLAGDALHARRGFRLPPRLRGVARTPER